MNGHWVSGTRKLNHRYQSALPSILRAYIRVIVSHQLSNVNYYFTPNGLMLSMAGGRTFVRSDLITIEGDYIPIAVLSDTQITADGVGFRASQLENEPFTNNLNADIIMRKETVTFKSKFDNSTMSIDFIVFLANRVHFNLYTDQGGHLWFDCTPLNGLQVTFPGINTKIAEVGVKFNLLVRDKFYYHTEMTSSTYDVTGGVVTPKNLNNLKSGNTSFQRTYKIDKSEWERTLPRPYMYDEYYGYKTSIMGNDPYKSVCPNLEGPGVRRGNFAIMFSGYESVIYYANKAATTYVQCDRMPGVLTTDKDSELGTNTATPQSYSVNGNFLCAPAALTTASYVSMFSNISGDDWSIDMDDSNRVFTGLIYMLSYGAPDSGSGSVLDLSRINDMWIYNV